MHLQAKVGPLLVMGRSDARALGVQEEEGYTSA